MFLSPPSASVLWVHTLFSLLYLCITVIFVVHYSLKLGKYQQELVKSPLVLACQIPIHTQQHFSSPIPYTHESLGMRLSFTKVLYVHMIQSNLTVMVQWIPKIAHREDILHHLQ